MGAKIIITRDDLEERMKNHISTNYMSLYSVMKSVTIAFAGIVFTSFVTYRAWEADRILFWFASFEATILTYNAVVIGSIVIYWMPTWRDVLFPFSLAVVEIMLFNILQINPNPPGRNSRISAWYLMFSIFGFTASLILHNVVSKLDTKNYTDDLEFIISKYRDGMIRDRRNSFIVGTGSLVVYGLCRIVDRLRWEQETIFYGFKARWIVVITGIAAVAVMALAMKDHETERKMIDRELVHYEEKQEQPLNRLPTHPHPRTHLRASHIILFLIAWVLRTRRRKTQRND